MKQPEVLSPITQADKDLAHETHQKILALIKDIKAKEASLDSGYVALGRNVHLMQSKTLWVALNYNSWKEYFGFIQEKFGIGRTQLIGYTSTVRTLQEHCSDDEMLQMGIGKASELKKAIRDTGVSPSEELLAKAVDKKVLVPEFRKLVLDEYHIKNHNVKGEWYDFKGCYLAPDEKQFVEKTFKLAKSIDPVVDHTLPAHAQFREVILRLCEEFWSQHGHQDQDNIDGFNQVYQSANQEEPFA